MLVTALLPNPSASLHPESNASCESPSRNSPRALYPPRIMFTRPMRSLTSIRALTRVALTARPTASLALRATQANFGERNRCFLGVESSQLTCCVSCRSLAGHDQLDSLSCCHCSCSRRRGGGVRGGGAAAPGEGGRPRAHDVQVHRIGAACSYLPRCDGTVSSVALSPCFRS